MHDAAGWDEWIRALYGDAAALARPAGVLHVTAVWQAPDAARLVTLRILAETPRSAYDARALGLARARSDAIVTSGRILREEPDLTHAPLVPEAEAAGLAAWRRERLGKPAPTRSLVLTSGRGLDLEHPLFRAAPGALVFTGEAAARALAAPARRAGVEVVGHPEPGLRAALDWLEAHGLPDVAVEAGPSTALELYRPPLRVDELMLSVFEEPGLPAPVRGGDFLAPAELDRLLPRAGRATERREPSGRWRFERRLSGSGC